MKRVCMIVPNRMVKGGIAAVVNGYRGSQLEKDYEITYVESYKDGSKFDKLLKGICGYFHFAYVLMFHKPDVVHIHSSFDLHFIERCHLFIWHPGVKFRLLITYMVLILTNSM